MELLHGRSLDAIIDDEAPLAPERVTALALQICASLEEAHEIGRIHRDIKPSNIMVERIGEKEHATVLDFGLVKQVHDTMTSRSPPTLTDPGARAGTPQYMAPELWSEEFGSIGPGVDIYALGVVLFQMLCKKRPFPSSPEISKIITNHLYQAPDLLSAHLNDAASIARFSPIVARCLAKRPEQRFPSIAAVKEALAAELAGEPRSHLHSHSHSIASARTQITIRPPLVDRRSGLALAGFAVFAGARAAGSVAVVNLARGGGKPAADAPVLKIESTPPGASVFIDGTPTGLTTPARIADFPDHAMIVSVCRAGCDGASKPVSLHQGEERVALELKCEPGAAP
jgi:serine/threonine protein kinase